MSRQESRIHVRGALVALPLLFGVSSAMAQFNAAVNLIDREYFDFTVADSTNGTNFSNLNWTLDSGCSSGLVIAEGTRQSSPPQALKIIRGGTGTRLVKDLNPGPGSSTIGEMKVNGNDVLRRVLFSADDNTGTNGKELYRVFEVLYPTTRLELDIQPGAVSSNPTGLFVISASNVIMAADDGTNGNEPWLTRTGTNLLNVNKQLLKDINPGPGSSNPSGFSTAGTVTVFAADDGTNGRELWKTDAAFGGAGTTILVDINTTAAGASSDPQQLTMVGSGSSFRAYFTADDGIAGRELFRTDGTVAGTGRVKDINAGPGGSTINNLVGGLGTLVTTAFFTVDSDGVNGEELWKSGGALDGSDTVMVIDLGASPSNLRPLGSVLYFTVGNSLYKTDGTAGNTVLLKTFTSISGPIVGLGSSIYFAADDGGGAGVEFWTSDGTNTVLAKDINPGPASSNPQNLASMIGRVLFSADDGTNGRELWRSDTSAGAVMIMDINPGPAGSNPANFNDFDGSALFTADDGVVGTELWQTDGAVLPARKGISHKWDLTAVIQDPIHDPSKIAVTGTDTDPLIVAWTFDFPTLGGGSNLVIEAAHQSNLYVELTDGIDRAPLNITNVNCGDGAGFTRPKAALTDGTPHKAIAVGMIAVLDQDPCDTDARGPNSPAVPYAYVPAIYDGLNWIPMSLANFPGMQSSPQLNGPNLNSSALPAGLVPATSDPGSNKRFANVRIDVLANTIRVFWHSKQWVPETTWMVELPRVYQGAFKALHFGANNCVPSAYNVFNDSMRLTGGLFVSSVDPFGSCCASSGCTSVASAAACTGGGIFTAWKSCSEVKCCPKPWADLDHDSDVDVDDFGIFQRCFTGAVGPIPAGCDCVNPIADSLIDTSDFDEFKKCGTGPTIPFNPGSPPAGCTPCLPSPILCP